MIKSPEVKTSKLSIKSESPENKPQNGQKSTEEKKVLETSSPEKKSDSNFLKIQSAGAGQKGSDYNPGKKNYNPIKDAFWKKGEK